MKKNLLIIGIGIEFVLLVCLFAYHIIIFPTRGIINNLGTKFLSEKINLLSELSLKISISISQPKINNKDIEDWEKVNILRQWAADHIPWATKGPLYINDSIQNKEANDIFYLYEQNIGGVDCGGAGYSLMKLYKLYGFEAYVYHHGTLDGWNHAVTLVKINNKGKSFLVIEDAHFNTTYTYQNGEPIDFFDFLQMVKDDKIEKFKLVKNGAKKHFNIEIENNKRRKHYVNTDYFYLEKYLFAYLMPRTIQAAIYGDEADVLMKKIQSLVVY